MTIQPANPRDDEAARILRDNSRDGPLGPYTVPTRGLYPFQWNWDSCLVAVGWARLDENRAFGEIETLLAAQWPDGMVPHIVFHQDDPGYFPGPERWGTGRTPPTSGITQPPVAASCVRRILEGAKDVAAAEVRAKALLPKLLAWHRWFHTARDPGGSGLVASVHPWETGADNSPGWDEALARVQPPADLEPYTRRDTGHVDPAMRPTQAEYDRYLTLVQLFREQGWRHEIATASPFRVASVETNCILHRGDKDLLALARRFGDEVAASEVEGWIARAEPALVALAHPTSGHWHSRDLVTGELVPAATSGGFLAAWAGFGDGGIETRLAHWLEGARFAVPTVSAGDPRFDAKRYWRGPVWAIMNFMIAEGLAEAGHTTLAFRLRADTAMLIETAGFHEYFDPLDGSGCGGAHFTWTAAIWLAWAELQA